MNQNNNTNESLWTYHETETGNYYLPADAPDDHISLCIKNNIVFDFEIYAAAKHYIKPDTYVLDVGSNFGQMAIMMSRHVGDKGRVFAFEANEFVYKTLEKNIKANNAPVTPYFAAVHNEPDKTLYFQTVDFKEFSTYGSYGIDYANNTGTPVKTMTIDSLQFDKQISFMKIDVQGGDLYAMQGAVQTIMMHRMPIVFEFEVIYQGKYKHIFQDYVNFVQSIEYYFAFIPMANNFLILPNKLG